MKPPAETDDWVRAVTALYLATDRHLDLFARGMNGDADFGPLRFGGCYRCLQSFRANFSGQAAVGEHLWFLGCYVFPYDGVHRLFFRDQAERERVFEFVDIYPETDELICGAFKSNPDAYFARADDPSGRSDALETLRQELVDRRRETTGF